jgi:hypothetical protein
VGQSPLEGVGSAALEEGVGTRPVAGGTRRMQTASRRSFDNAPASKQGKSARLCKKPSNSCRALGLRRIRESTSSFATSRGSAAEVASMQCRRRGLRTVPSRCGGSRASQWLSWWVLRVQQEPQQVLLMLRRRTAPISHAKSTLIPSWPCSVRRKGRLQGRRENGECSFPRLISFDALKTLRLTT